MLIPKPLLFVSDCIAKAKKPKYIPKRDNAIVQKKTFMRSMPKMNNEFDKQNSLSSSINSGWNKGAIWLGI